MYKKTTSHGGKITCWGGLILLCFGLTDFVLARPHFQWSRYDSKDDSWYRSDDGKRIAENILSFQDEYGCWPKNIDTATEKAPHPTEKMSGTFDNYATTGEMRFMARMFNAAQDVRYKAAFIKALDTILKAQYPTGGWPQCYPSGDGYARYITFNDNAMVNLMNLLRDIAEKDDYRFVEDSRRKAAAKAFDRGIECILKCQVRVNGKLTVWCAQHDEMNYAPRPARSYELISLSGGESAAVLQLLMSLDKPSPPVIQSINAGVDWYRYSKIIGLRTTWVDGKFRVVSDPDAPPVWGRFYNIETNRPFFCDRDGIPKDDFNQIDQERSTGYAWYGRWGDDVFRSYEKWRKRHKQ